MDASSLKALTLLDYVIVRQRDNHDVRNHYGHVWCRLLDRPQNDSLQNQHQNTTSQAATGHKGSKVTEYLQTQEQHYQAVTHS